MKKTFKKLLSVAVSAAIVLQYPVFLNTAYAEPSEQEEEITVSENEAVSGDDILESPAEEEGSGAEEGAEGEQETGSEEMTVSENDTGDDIEEDGPDTEENAEGQAVEGGYIEMPWDNDTPVADRRLDYDEALKMIVEDGGDAEEAAGYVTEPQTIEAKYPAGSDSEVLTYLKNKYPATRSQSPYGSCWAHSSIALSEFYMISHGLSDSSGSVDNNVDYSELALAYFCYHQAPDPVNGITGDTVTYNDSVGRQKTFLDFGGNLGFSSQSLMRYNGVTNDQDAAAYSNAEAVLSGGLDDEYAASKDTAHLKNVYQINIRQNANLVKQAIKENGIVGVSIYAHESYMNTAHSAFYNNEKTETNHAVALVGWNDDFPKEYFNTQPSGNGAWLVRNSWTTFTNYSYYSYFWLSYEDTSLASTAYVFEMADTGSGEYYDNNYNYDSQLHDVTTADSSTVANVFTAVKNSETLKAVQIDSTMNIAGNYTVSIYKNLTDSSDPESGTLVSGASGELPFAGRYTIPLSEPVDLSEGETFSVVLSTDRKIDQETDLTWLEQIVMDTAVNEGESFAKLNGVWKDEKNYSSGGRYGNVCIRALTKTNGESQLPDSIRSLSVRNRTQQSVTLAWSAAKDAEGYEVWYSNAENGTYSLAGTTSSSEKKFKHTGLSAATTYFYKVYPVKNGSKYDAGVSPVVSAGTLAATPNVEVINIGNYTATARWDALDGCDGYKYKYGRNGNGGYPAEEISENSVLLDFLDPGTEHWIEVSSYKILQNGEKSYSDTCRVTFTTQNGHGHAVTNLKASPYNSSEVKLTWDEQEEAYSFYIEQSVDGETFTASTVYYRGSPEPRTIRYAGELESNTQYYFRIKALFYKYGAESDIYYSDPVICYPKLPAVTVNSTTLTGENVVVKWSAVTGANYYTVFRKESSASEFVPLTVVPASGELQFTDTTVLPGRRYYYMVCGCRTNNATDTEGSAYNFRSLLIHLDRVTDLTVNRGSRTADLNWSPIRGAQGYKIMLNDMSTVSEVGRTDPQVTSFKLTGLQPGSSYRVGIDAFTDEDSSSGTRVSFNTKTGDPAQASFFTVKANNCTYDGLAHGADVTCSVNEINTAGYTVKYGRVENGEVSDYSEALPVNAGTYRIRIITNQGGGYTPTILNDPSWEYTIAPKAITPVVTLSPTSYVYSGAQKKPAVTVKDGSTLLSQGTDYTVSYGENIHAGNGTVTVTQKTGGNYSFAEKTETFTIGKKTTSVTIAGGNRTVTYGAGNISLTATAATPGSSGQTWTWSSDNSSVASVNASTGVLTVNGQGTAVITAAYSSNDTEGTGSITITVNRAGLTVRANDNTIIYGDAPAGNGVTYSGFVNGDTSAVVTGDPSYSYSYSRYGSVGNSYRITPSGLSASNYDITYVPGTLTVVQKEAELNWTGTSLTYNGEAQKPSAVVTNLVNNDSCTVTVAGEQTDAGAHTATATALTNPNYKLPAVKTTSFTIAKAAYGNKTASGSARYGNSGRADLSPYVASGGSLKTEGITASDPNGILNGTPEVSEGGLNFIFVNDPSKLNMTADVTVGVNGGTNYEDYTITVTLTVLDKIPQTVTFTGVTGGTVNKTYGDADFTQAAVSDGGGTITYSSSDETVATVTPAGKVSIIKAGSATITATAAATDSYASGSASYTLIVSKKQAGITWTQTVFTYDRTAHVPSASASGLKIGDTCNLTVTGEQTNAGTYTAAVTGLDNANYSLPALVTKEFTINKRQVRVSGIGAESRDYDGTCMVTLDYSAVSFNGLISPDTLSVTAAGEFETAKAGTGKKVRISDLDLGGAGYENYVLSETGQQTETSADIRKISHGSEVLSSEAAFGSSGSVDLTEKLAEGAVPGNIEVIEDDHGLLDGMPVLDGNILKYSFNGTAEDIGSSAVVSVSANDADNYKDYGITVTLTVTANTCTHPSWELQGRKEPTCTQKGYTGNKVCTECGHVIEYGEDIDIDPDNHDFDEGKETEPATLYKEGVITFTCRRCGYRKTEAIPKLEGSGDMEDILKDTEDLSGNALPEVIRSEDEEGNDTESFKVGGEEVSKTVIDRNTGRKTVESKVWIAGLKSSYTYTGSPIKPDIHVYDGTVLLKQDTDYTVTYSNNKNAGNANIAVKFKGNYINSQDVTAGFVILPAVLGKDVIASEAGLAAKKGAQKVVPVFTHTSTGKTVNAKAFTCDPETVEEAGIYDITVKPDDPNFTGQTVMKVRVVDDKNLLLSNAKVTFSPKSYPYTGKEIRPEVGSYKLKLGKDTLTEGTDYRVTGLYNNTDPGSATMVFEAISGNRAGYVGSRTASFKITGKLQLKGQGEGFYYTYPSSVPYAKGGARPKVTIRDKNNSTLKEGRDYTLSYKNNKAVTLVRKAEIIVKGKGIYKGSVSLTFDVTKQNIETLKDDIIAADQFVMRSKVKSPTVIITDLDGKTLKAKKDFTVGKPQDADPGNTGTEGIMKVSLTGTGLYEGNCEVFFKYMQPSGDISKAKIMGRIEDQAYNGQRIELDETMLAGIVYMENNGSSGFLVPGTDFAAVRYQNNIKKGTAKVTIRGLGSLGGTKVLNFRIVQKPVDYRGALIGGEWR